MAEVGEGAAGDEGDAVEDDDGEEIHVPPGLRDAVREDGDDARERVTDPDVERVGGGLRYVAVPDGPGEDAFADEGGQDMGGDDDGEPAQGAEPAFGVGVEDGVEDGVGAQRPLSIQKALAISTRTGSRESSWMLVECWRRKSSSKSGDIWWMMKVVTKSAASQM